MMRTPPTPNLRLLDSLGMDPATPSGGPARRAPLDTSELKRAAVRTVLAAGSRASAAGAAPAPTPIALADLMIDTRNPWQRWWDLEGHLLGRAVKDGKAYVDQCIANTDKITAKGVATGALKGGGKSLAGQVAQVIKEGKLPVWQKAIASTAFGAARGGAGVAIAEACD